MWTAAGPSSAPDPVMVAGMVVVVVVLPKASPAAVAPVAPVVVIYLLAESSGIVVLH